MRGKKAWEEEKQRKDIQKDRHTNEMTKFSTIVTVNSMLACSVSYPDRVAQKESEFI